jgi:uncharacterized protein YgbK (DUF1537 family)
MILVLADDMTGALEVGAVFSKSGFRAIVSTRTEPNCDAEVCVVDTETRHSTPTVAFEKTINVVRAFSRTPELIYKKTDSTLRGNIRAELNGLATIFPHWRIGYASAYPEQGRIVRNGIVHVNNVPLSDTTFARDILNPVSTSSVRELIGPNLRCTIFDGATNSDVRSAAQTILSDEMMRIAVGPADLEAALAKCLRAERTDNQVLPLVKSCIVLNGSRTPLSQSQVEYAEQHQCVARNNASAWQLADVPVAEGSLPAAVAASRAKCVIGLLQGQSTDAVLIIGGDTVYAFIRTLGEPPITPVAEILPGVPVSRIGKCHLKSSLAEYDRDLILITKAGGFGEMDVLCRVRRILEQNAG